jgi:hypothetical protein
MAAFLETLDDEIAGVAVVFDDEEAHSSYQFPVTSYQFRDPPATQPGNQRELTTGN